MVSNWLYLLLIVPGYCTWILLRPLDSEPVNALQWLNQEERSDNVQQKGQKGQRD